MPRLTLKALKSKAVLALVAGAVATGAALAVLYVILSGPVYAVAQPPEALARLKPEKRPQTVPAVAFSDGAGRRHMLSEFRGRYVLLNLWATWCGPCVRELPALAALQAAVPKGQLTVIAVNVGRSGAAETTDFLGSHHAANLGVYLDTAIALVRAFDAYSLPLSVLIDPEGHLVARAAGPSNWDAPTAIGYFKALPLPKIAPGSASKPARAAS